MAKKKPETQLLTLLKSVLPQAVPDAKLADLIYSAMEKAINTTERVASFDKFCKRAELPDLEKASLSEVKKHFETAFGQGVVSLVPHPAKKAVSVEVVTPQGTFEGVVKVGEAAALKEAGEEEEIKVKFVPFPVGLESDPELVWLMARDERLTPEEAGIALTKAQESFWESKAGQQHLRKRVERSFPEFMAKVPGKMLTETGLKRHYKEPEPLKLIKLLKPKK